MEEQKPVFLFPIPYYLFPISAGQCAKMFENYLHKPKGVALEEGRDEL